MAQGNWNLDKARRVWALPWWSDGYVDAAADGRLVLRPGRTSGPSIALAEAVAAARADGLRLPMLLRFPDVLGDRLSRLQQAFAAAFETYAPGGRYTAVFPIKVNQQQAVVGELVARGGAQGGFGLEAGSKPELLAVLAQAEPGMPIICNGYKDRAYMRLALIGQRMGLEVIIVIEKPAELAHVLAEARALGVRPQLGVRVRLASLGAGKWQNTGGALGKFGLSPRQVLRLLDDLAGAGLTDCLRLLHFHMGSQISNVRDIASGMREAVRYFVELRKLGVPLDTVDVGGGLGIDYDGTRSRSFNSINYSLEQYAGSVVQPLAEACQAQGLAMPRLITEAGRAMTAHHAVLVVNTNDVEPRATGRIPRERADEPDVLRRLRAVHAALGERPPLELLHEAQYHLGEGRSLFALGQLDLADRARLDDLYHSIVNAVRAQLDPARRGHRQSLDDLDQQLVDKYFGNFSIFESTPDVWAIDQVFPIMPLTRLDEAPTRRGVLVDVTCDSDGRIDHYAGADGLDVSLPLHAPRAGEPYLLGIFLVGAYQETLGDIHNLFGDTDAVNVQLDEGPTGFRLSRPRHGDSAGMMLEYVGYQPEALRAEYRRKLAGAGLPNAEAERLALALDEGLAAYTYLQPEP